MQTLSAHGQNITLANGQATASAALTALCLAVPVKTLRAQMTVDAISGGTPSLTVKMQDSIDGSAWNDLASFAWSAAVTAGNKGLATFSGLVGPYVRCFGTVSGSNQASVVTVDPAGANNSIDWTSVATDGTGDGITIAYVSSGAINQTLLVTTVGNAITVRLATDGSGVITSTAAQVITAVNADGSAGALLQGANHAANSGAGLLTVMPPATLTNGLLFITSHVDLVVGL